jgi:hypothetical protein
MPRRRDRSHAACLGGSLSWGMVVHCTGNILGIILVGSLVLQRL